jgi:hypothetical protein
MEEIEKPINRYSVKVVVEYYYEVEAETAEQAEEEGWNYEEHPYNAEVYSIDVDLEEEDIYGEEPEEDEDLEDESDEDEE